MTTIFRGRPGFSLIALIGISVCILIFTASRLPAQSIPPKSAEAIQSEDWATLANELSGVTRDEPSTVLRLIAGHALLATNRNNASLELFASALDDASLSEWEEWTEAFAGENPDSSAAWYYTGDAQARLQNWEAAIEAFDRALEINPQSFLALNAKGIAHHGVGSSVQARKFIAQSAKINLGFADAHASRAVLGLYGGQSRAEKHALAAIEASEDVNPAASLNAQALALFFGKDFEGAKRVFENVPANSALGGVAEGNLMIVELARTGILDEGLRTAAALEQSDRLGMSVTAQSLVGVSDNLVTIEQSPTSMTFAVVGSNILLSKSSGPEPGPCKRWCIKIGPGGIEWEKEYYPPIPEDPEDSSSRIEPDNVPAKMTLGPGGLGIPPWVPPWQWPPLVPLPPELVDEEQLPYFDKVGPIRSAQEILGLIDLDSSQKVARALQSARSDILNAMETTTFTSKLGGVDSLPPISHAGTVIPVYGLLYSIPLDAASGGS